MEAQSNSPEIVHSKSPLDQLQAEIHSIDQVLQTTHEIVDDIVSKHRSEDQVDFDDQLAIALQNFHSDVPPPPGLSPNIYALIAELQERGLKEQINNLQDVLGEKREAAIPYLESEIRAYISQKSANRDYLTEIQAALGRDPDKKAPALFDIVDSVLVANARVIANDRKPGRYELLTNALELFRIYQEQPKPIQTEEYEQQVSEFTAALEMSTTGLSNLREIGRIIRTYKRGTSAPAQFNDQYSDLLYKLDEFNFVFSNEYYKRAATQDINFLKAITPILVDINEQTSAAIEKELASQPPEKKMFDSLPFPITGLEASTDSELIITPNELINMLTYHEQVFDLDDPTHWQKAMLQKIKLGTVIPGDFIDGIVSLHFTNELPSVRYSEDQELNQLLKRLRINGTIYHEIMEHTMKNLSVRELIYWEKMRKETKNEQGEEINITEYVRYVRETDNIEITKSEDLCESAALYFTVPSQLFLLDQNRYIFMLQLVAYHLPPHLQLDYIEGQTLLLNLTKAHTDQASEDGLRSALLEHETIPRKRFLALPRTTSGTNSPPKELPKDKNTSKHSSLITINRNINR